MSQILEVSSIELGGRIAGYNDAHYGMPWVILTSGRGKNMGDGWETRRRREPGHDWILVRLGATAEIEKIEVDTAHFKGNYPDRCSLQGTGCQGKKLAGTLISAKTFHGSTTFFSKTTAAGFGAGQLCPLEYLPGRRNQPPQDFWTSPVLRIDASNFTHSAYRSSLY